MNAVFSEAEFEKFVLALRYASIQHCDQRRKGQLKAPYINHPLELVSILWEVGGIRDMDTLVAALLHDTVEDTSSKPEEISQMFGEEVQSLVMELTDDKNLPKAERKRLQVEHAPHKSPRARQIKLADKISNVKEISEDPPDNWEISRRIEYLNWTEQVVNGLRGHHPALEARFDEVLAQGRARFEHQK